MAPTIKDWAFPPRIINEALSLQVCVQPNLRRHFFVVVEVSYS